MLAAAVESVRERTPRLFAAPGGPSSDSAPSAAARKIAAEALEAAGLSQAAAAPGSDGATLPLIMMVVGVPNVGKSSIINAFRRLAILNAPAVQAGAGASRIPDKPRSRRPAKVGPMPGVTTSLSGFQVSWKPSVWVLDTPGVLSPKVDGGWEAALRLGCLDLIKYDHASVEAIGAYAVHHLATTNPTTLDRWPTTRLMAMRKPAAEAGKGAADVAGRIEGYGPDPLGELLGSGRADDAAAACSSERYAMRLLERVAADMNLWHWSTRRLDTGSREGMREKVLDLHSAAVHVLALLRKGELGSVCFDAHPLTLEAKRQRERAGRDDRAKGSDWRRQRRRAMAKPRVV